MPRSAGIQRYTTKAGTRWAVRYKDAGGQWRSRGGFDKKDLAQAALALYASGNSNAAESLNPSRRRKPVSAALACDEHSPVTVGEFAERWLDTCDLAKTTISGYRRNLIHHVLPHLGGAELGSITPLMLKRLYSTLLAHGRVTTERNTLYTAAKHKGETPPEGLGADTVRKIHYMLSAMFKVAILHGLIDTNPCASPLASPPKMSLVRFERPEIEVWDDALILRYLVALRDVDPLIYVGTLLVSVSGLRRGELIALQVGSIDLTHGKVRVSRNRVSYREGGRQYVVEVPPKSGKERRVAIGESAVGILREYMIGMEIDLRRSLRKTDYLFTNGAGNAWIPESWSRRWRRSTQKVRELMEDEGIELPQGRFHDLRHSHATFLIRQGVHPKIIQERLGHSSITTTMSIYAHLLDSDQREAGDMSDVLVPKVRGTRLKGTHV